MFELKDGLNFHNFYRDCQPKRWFKKREGETVVECVMRIAYQVDESLLRPTIRNEDSFRISLAVLSFLRENNLSIEQMEDDLGMELDLSSHYDYKMSEICKINNYMILYKKAED